MNGPIAQLVALTCHGNAALRQLGGRAPFFPHNSTCKFCDRITFIELQPRLLRTPALHSVASTPDEWFEHLARTGARGLRLLHQPRERSWVSDRMTAGLIGGGAVWTIAVRHERSTRYWKADWMVWNRQAPDQRIWRVGYRSTALRPGSPATGPELRHARREFVDALTRIHAFAEANDSAPFTDCFRRALASLVEPYPAHGYHTDLCPSGMLPADCRAILDAAQSAWVFGGMGSWNDLGFDGAAATTYDEVSRHLYAAMQDAICAAANAADENLPDARA
jgi:hypothetical protein